MMRAKANPLVTALAAGEPDAFAALYDRLGRSMLRVAVVVLRSAVDAEDAVQDVFVELVRRRDQMPQVQDLDAYVFAMLRNAVVRRIHQVQREQLHLRRMAPREADEPVAALADGLETALGALPAEQREVISLKIDAGLTFAQIGQLLGVSQNTAASRYRYAIQKLRDAME